MAAAHLPDEVLEAIFEHCDWRDLGSMRLASRKAREAVHCTVTAVRSSFPWSSCSEHTQFFEFLQRITNLQHLSLRAPRCRDWVMQTTVLARLCSLELQLAGGLQLNLADLRHATALTWLQLDLNLQPTPRGLPLCMSLRRLDIWGGTINERLPQMLTVIAADVSTEGIQVADSNLVHLLRLRKLRLQSSGQTMRYLSCKSPELQLARCHLIGSFDERLSRITLGQGGRIEIVRARDDEPARCRPRVLECWDLNAMHHYERDVVVESFRALQHVHLEQASVDDLAVLAPDHLPNLTCLSIATPTGLQHHATLDGLMLERLQYLRLPHCDVQLPCYDLWLKCRHALECGCGVNVTWQGIWW